MLGLIEWRGAINNLKQCGVCKRIVGRKEKQNENKKIITNEFADVC